MKTQILNSHKAIALASLIAALGLTSTLHAQSRGRCNDLVDGGATEACSTRCSSDEGEDCRPTNQQAIDKYFKCVRDVMTKAGLKEGQDADYSLGNDPDDGLYFVCQK